MSYGWNKFRRRYFEIHQNITSRRWGKMLRDWGNDTREKALQTGALLQNNAFTKHLHLHLQCRLRDFVIKVL